MSSPSLTLQCFFASSVHEASWAARFSSLILASSRESNVVMPRQPSRLEPLKSATKPLGGLGGWSWAEESAASRPSRARLRARGVVDRDRMESDLVVSWREEENRGHPDRSECPALAVVA